MKKMTRKEWERRYAYEDLLAVLLLFRVDVDELTVRLTQAIQRTPLVRSVLEPGLERLDELRTALDQAQDTHRRRDDGQ